MDIEQIKLIMEMMKNLGEHGQTAFIYWLLMKYAFPYTIGLVWTFITIYFIKLGYRLISNYAAAERLRRAAKISYRWSESELQEACDILKKYFPAGKRTDILD